MCGIAGFIDFLQETDIDVIKNMTNTIKHRGPDDVGYFYDNDKNTTIAFGHRRLSIIDLTQMGHQPMKFKHLTIIYNGEIYNFFEIREDLINKYNRNFESNSDTEVILQAFDQWGVDCVKRINGMFAFAIHDKLNNKVYLFRDRAGIKPLYFHIIPGLILFGSELKSFHKHPKFKKNICHDALAEYLQYGYVPAPLSIFQHTFKVMPGEYLEINITNQDVKKFKYWDVLDCYKEPKIQSTEEEILTELEILLKSACSYRLVSDVPVGLFLSGGYDSSCVAALLQKDNSVKINTFTIGFKESKYNEAGFAKDIANYLGTNHQEYFCSEKEAKEIIQELPSIFDEPFGDSSAIPTILVSRFAKKDVKVVLSADAGDEIFGGYTKYKTINNYHKYFNSIPKIGRKTISIIFDKIRNVNLIEKINISNPLNKYDAFTEILKNKSTTTEINKYLTKRISNKKLQSLCKFKIISNSSFLDHNYNYSKEYSELEKVFAIDYKTYLSDDILVKVDRATMSQSIEGREPFLDYRIIEYVSRLPFDLKIKQNNNKYILKKIVHKYIPEKLLDRPKIGFAIPIKIWFRDELKFYFEQYFDKKIIEKQELFNYEVINNMLIRFNNGVDDDFELLWFILIFQMWHKEWL